MKEGCIALKKEMTPQSSLVLQRMKGFCGKHGVCGAMRFGIALNKPGMRRRILRRCNVLLFIAKWAHRGGRQGDFAARKVFIALDKIALQ